MEQVPTLNIGSSNEDAMREARWRGARMGLTPLLCLALVVVTALVFAPVVRTLLVSQGFFVEQEAEVVVLGGGLVLAAVVYGATLVRSLRRARHWHRAGLAVEASAALVALAASGVIVALPVILAFMFPQQPAP